MYEVLQRNEASCVHLHIFFRDVSNVNLPPPLKADVLHRLSRKEILGVPTTKELVLKGEGGGKGHERKIQGVSRGMKLIVDKRVCGKCWQGFVLKVVGCVRSGGDDMET